MQTLNEHVCAICGSNEFKFVTNAGDGFTDTEASYLCMYCGLIFLHPASDKSDFYLSDKFSEYFRGGEKPGPLKRATNLQNAAERWKAIVATNELPDLEEIRILEIGCSSGELLETIESYLDEEGTASYDLHGIDPSTGYAKANKSGAMVVVGTFPEENLLPEGMRYDLIVTMHTLEHVHDPKAFLAAVHDRLEPGGIFVVEYPDVGRAALREKIPTTYFQTSHLFDFSEPNMGPLMAMSGFEIVAVGDYSEYPKDKNVMLICRKADDFFEGEFPDRSEYAQHLFAALTSRLFLEDEYRNELVKGISKRKATGPLRIVHVASHQINIGDGAITTGIRWMVDKLLSGYPTEWVNMDIVDYTYDGKGLDVGYINDVSPDLVLFGGGGTIDGHKTRVKTGTAIEAALDQLSSINAPLAFIGLGHNVYHNQKHYHLDALERFISFCAEEDYPFSVRRDKSWERLAQSFSPQIMETVHRIPDPGFFVQTNGRTHHTIPPFETHHITIQLAIDAFSHRFPETDDDEMTSGDKTLAFISTIVDWMSELTQSSSFSVALHTTPDHTAFEVMTRMPKFRDNNLLKRILTRTTEVAHPVFAPSFFNLYNDSKLVVGMRGHSVICAAGLQTPVIPISTHPKVAGFSEEAGLVPWTLYPQEKDFTAKFAQSTFDLITNPEEQLEAVADATKNWENEFAEFMQGILAKV